MPSLPSTGRYPEIDLLRMVAVLGMVLYHTAYDLAELYAWGFDPLHGGWWFFARSTAVLFLLVSGASNTIANTRAKNAGGTHAMWQRTIKRSLQIASAALLVTLATYISNPETYVRFGILHSIALSVFLLPLFQKFRQWNLLLGAAIILVGTVTSGMTVHTSLLLPLGILPPHFSTLDYFPLLPWFGMVLIGSAVADMLYMQRGFSGVHLSFFLSVFCASISRWSLMIYLAHQPVILLMLMLFFGKPTP